MSALTPEEAQELTESQEIDRALELAFKRNHNRLFRHTKGGAAGDAEPAHFEHDPVAPDHSSRPPSSFPASTPGAGARRGGMGSPPPWTLHQTGAAATRAAAPAAHTNSRHYSHYLQGGSVSSASEAGASPEASIGSPPHARQVQGASQPDSAPPFQWSWTLRYPSEYQTAFSHAASSNHFSQYLGSSSDVPFHQARLPHQVPVLSR